MDTHKVFYLPCLPWEIPTLLNIMKEEKTTTLQQFKNKLNGLKYFKIPKKVKYIDGEKFVLCLQVNGGQAWIREDVLEFDKLLQI